MELKHRQFKNNVTNEVVTVIDSFENVVILDDRTKTSPLVILNPNLYTEVSLTKNNTYNSINESFNSNESFAVKNDEVDVSSFFGNQNAYNSLADKIKNIPVSQMGNSNEVGAVQVNVDMANQLNAESFIPQSTENIVYEVSDEEEKEALSRKYGLTSPDINSINKQNDAFSKILGEDEDLLDIPEEVHKQNVVIDEEPIQRIEVKRESAEYLPELEKINKTETETETEDPIIKMFKGVKRNLTFNMNIELSDKIPRIDFIEMMEDSYESSIIDFIATEFTEKILSDPNQIKNLIKDKIKKMVYGEVLSKEEKEPAKKEPAKKEPAKKKRVYKKKNELAND